MKSLIDNFVGAIFGMVGIGLLIGAIVSYSNQQNFLKGAQQTDGTVRELVFSRSRKGSGTYKPVVTFYTSDRQPHTFTSNLGTNPASYKVGERVTVVYNPTNPTDAQITGFWNSWGLSLLLGVLGSIFSAIGLGIVYSKINRSRTIKDLLLNGIPINIPARVEYTTTKGIKRYYLRSEWYNNADGKVYLLDSETLPFDPTPFLPSNVKIWIDPRNPKRHYVDTSFLPTVG